MPVTITERFAAACSPVIASSYDTCGTITRASIDHLSLSDLAALFAPGGLYADLDAWFFHSIEMKACGVRRYALYDWIMANADRTNFRAAVTGIKAVKSPSLIQPFIFGRQESIVNRDYWKVTNGWTKAAYDALNGADGSNDYPLTAADLATGSGSSRVIRVESRHGIPMDEKWFRDRDSLHIFNRDAGVSQHGQWKVTASRSNATLTFTDVLVESMNAGSSEPYNSAPTSGVLIPGVNNVSDYESWCHNRPTIDPRKRVPFWVQTWRMTRCVDSEYRKVYERLYDSNPAFREFGDLELSERNRQDELEYQKRFVNDFFYNKPISANQTLTNWESLESITTVTGANTDPGLGGKLIGKRANFVGVMEQLRVCDRVFELNNQALNLEEFFDLNYDIMRARQSSGRKVTDIDWFTDSVFRTRFHAAMMQYYKDLYLDQLRITVQVNQVSEQLGIIYDSYFVKRPGGVRINIISDEYFDDRLAEFEASDIGSAGRVLWALDIGKPGAGSIYYAQIATNRKVYTTAKIEELAKLDSTFRCVLEHVSLEQTLMSETGTVVVECPLNSAVIQGIGDIDPVTTGKTVVYGNLY